MNTCASNTIYFASSNGLAVNAAEINHFKVLVNLPKEIAVIPVANLHKPPAYFTVLDQQLCLLTAKFKPFNCYQYYLTVIEPRLHQNSILNNLLGDQDVNKPSGPVLDLFAGLGRDSFIFLNKGNSVIAIENNPYIFVMLSYFNELYYKSFLKKLELKYLNSCAFIADLNQNISGYPLFRIIYLDPMFADKKSALPPKDMQIIAYLNDIYGQQDDNIRSMLTFSALSPYCSGRIIVKRDNRQQQLFADHEPTFTKSGKCIRFDCYQCG